MEKGTRNQYIEEVIELDLNRTDLAIGDILLEQGEMEARVRAIRVRVCGSHK